MPSSEHPPLPADASSQDVERSWARIEAWTCEHLPELAASFQPPATEGAIREAEKKLGVTFPEDVRASYLRHDGQSYPGPDLIYFEDVFQLLSLEEMLGEAVDWRALKEEMEEEIDGFDADDGIRPEAFHRQWVPLGKAGSTDLVVVDLAPDDGGTRGQLVEVTHDSDRRRLVGPSLGAWLRQLADDLEAGRYRLGRYHLERRGGPPIFRTLQSVGGELPPFEERFPDLEKLASEQGPSNSVLTVGLKEALTSPETTDWFDVFREEVQPEVGALRELRRLSIRDSGRTIPPELGYLTKLEKLVIESDRGSLGAFPRALRMMGSESEAGLVIELSWSRVGTFPAVFLEMPQLTELQLMKCGLTELPVGLGRLPRLKALRLDHNDLGELPADLAECSSLGHLSMSLGWFDVKRDQVLGTLSQLVLLELRDGQLSELPASLAALKRLKELMLEGNHLRRLNRLTFASLEAIRLSGNRIALAADVAPLLDANPTLQKVELRSNPISLLPAEQEALKAAYPTVRFEFGDSLMVSELDPVADAMALERIASEAKSEWDVRQAKELLAKRA